MSDRAEDEMIKLPPCYRCKSQPCQCKDGITIYHADCRGILPLLSDVTAIVTDPPYELGFMGKKWDSTGVAFQPETWAAVMATCKPGTPLLAFGGTRTYHRLVCAIEDAGWQIRDCLAWVYGSGFPKSLDIGKAIDRTAGAEREVVGQAKRTGKELGTYGAMAGNNLLTAPATPLAQLWDGWGTALKPAHEPIVLAMKPLDGTFAQNALEHGVAGLNVDGTRIQTDEHLQGGGDKLWSHYRDEKEPSSHNRYTDSGATNIGATPGPRGGSPSGRWPANLLHDGSDEVLEVFPETTSGKLQPHHKRTQDKKVNVYGDWTDREGSTFEGASSFGDSGSASRFFYCAKADKAERGKGNTHSTVKPLALMSYLCKLVSMPGYTGTLLDPFAGSGSTLLAATRWFENVIGIEQDEESYEIAVRRLA